MTVTLEDHHEPVRVPSVRVLFDIVHPAHVHFYRFMWESLTSAGHEALVVSRAKDVTEQLLDEFGIPHRRASMGPSGTWLGQGVELVGRDARLVQLSRKFRPDIVLTRNPAGVHAARILRVPGVFDTDNGTSAGIHFRLAAPFATVITTPTGMGEHYGSKHREYPSYKALAFLHPKRFTPDPQIRDHLGVGPSEPFFIVRFVAMSASHDHGHVGLSPHAARRVMALLSERGRVFVSSEKELPQDLVSHRLPTSPGQFHSVLAEAGLCVGDSGSVAAEAALLGTPSIFFSSFAGKLAYLNELETRYGLVRNVSHGDEGNLIGAVDQWGGDDGLGQTMVSNKERMLEEKVDLTEWYLDLITEIVR